MYKQTYKHCDGGQKRRSASHGQSLRMKPSKPNFNFFTDTPNGRPVAELDEPVDARQGFYLLTRGQIGKHKLCKYWNVKRPG